MVRMSSSGAYSTTRCRDRLAKSWDGLSPIFTTNYSTPSFLLVVCRRRFSWTLFRCCHFILKWSNRCPKDTWSRDGQTHQFPEKFLTLLDVYFLEVISRANFALHCFSSWNVVTCTLTATVLESG